MKKIIHTPNAPGAIGPYSQAVAIGDLVFCSGQTPLNPVTGKLLEGTVGEQTAQCLKNLGSILDAAGLAFEDVVRCTVYLTDMGTFAEMNEVYDQFFDVEEPSRVTVEVSGLPMGAQVEISCIAHRPTT